MICTCRRYGLKCVAACGKCRGEICENAERGMISSRKFSYYIHPVNRNTTWNRNVGKDFTSLVEAPHYFIGVEENDFENALENDLSLFPEQFRKKRNTFQTTKSRNYYSYGDYNGGLDYHNNNNYNNIQKMKDLKWDQRPLQTLYYIETAVFVDEALYNKYLKEYGPTEPDKLEIFLLSLISNVDQLLSHNSLGGLLKVILVHTEILTQQPYDLDTGDGDIDGYLNNFCKWQEKRMSNQPFGIFGHRLHWDHAILLTGVDLHRKDSRTGRKNTSYVGYAYVNGMCNPKFSCTINEGTSFRGVFVTAHEMGHSMGMTHDGEDNSNSCDGSSFLMSPSLHPKLGKPKTSWSTCSRSQLHNFLRSSHSACLENNAVAPSHLDFDSFGNLPGDKFTPDQQCRVFCGKNCSAHSAQLPDEICEALVCIQNNKRRIAHQALEGTKCGENKKCKSGKCKIWQNEKRPQKTLPIATVSTPPTPQWMEWKSYGQACQSNCLLETNRYSPNEISWGIIHETRLCSRSGNGNQCDGSNHRVRLCDYTHVCHKITSPINVNQYADGICRDEHIYRDKNIMPTPARLPYADLFFKTITLILNYRVSDTVELKEIRVRLKLFDMFINENVKVKLIYIDMKFKLGNAKKSCQIWCSQRNGEFISRYWFLPDGSPCKAILPGSKAFCVKRECVQFGCDGLPLKFSDPSSCREAVHWANNHFGPSTSNSINDNPPTFEQNSPECKNCLYRSVEITKMTKHCDQWGRCTLRTEFRHKNCVCQKSADDYAAEKCNDLRQKHGDILSGYGKMLMSTSGDENLACYVCCESRENPSLFYKMEKPLVLMPDGTNCSQNTGEVKYCYQGYCLHGSLSRKKRSGETVERVFTDLGQSKVFSGVSFLNNNQPLQPSPTKVETTLIVKSSNDSPQLNSFTGRMNIQQHHTPYKWQTVISKCNTLGKDCKRTVKVTCISTDNYAQVDTSFCKNLIFLDSNRTESCRFADNENHHWLNKKTQWSIGEWHKCTVMDSSNRCIGQKSRSVVCTMNVGEQNVEALVGDQYCSGNKPHSAQKCKLSDICKKPAIGSWTEFNIRTRDNGTVKPDKVGYLPTINAPATELSTVQELLSRSVFIQQHPSLDKIAVIMDQALYAKAAEVAWKHKLRFESLLLMMGNFHIICNMLSIIGKLFRDAGLRDLAVESGVIAEGSIDKVLDGKQYNRGVRLHKLIYEALMRLVYGLRHPVYINDVTNLQSLSESDSFSSYADASSPASVQIGNWKFEVGRVFNLPNAIKKSGEIWQHRIFKLAKASPSCEGIIEVMDFEAGGKLKRKEKSFSQLLGPVARSLKALSSE
ncbi:A disintegrin and metalloproteinase with thrombospondin motifs adt-1 [Nymphon striatum]|nr:A disintegrin and metalloproteinase with thrombospondin motifs adt-1 [Nymphon striatum]